MQTLAAAAGLNVLHPEEIRDAAIEILSILTTKKMPTVEDLEILKFSGNPQEPQGGEGESDLEIKNRKEQEPSYGDNTNRSEVGAHEYDSSDGNDYK